MPQTEVAPTLELTMNRTVNAPLERVFRAWTVPAEMDRWFSPLPEASVKSAVDLRVGGEYKIEITNEGRVFGAFGVYREIRPPERLVFTWNTVNCGETIAKDTLVTVEFFEVGNKTQITLTHQNFASEEARNSHREGWRGCFNNFEAIF